MEAWKQPIREKLSALVPRTLRQDHRARAAVLMGLSDHDGEPHFVLTRRTFQVATHKGQISFPGGVRDGGESLEATALRETEEELGIKADYVELVGPFHEYLSSTLFLVTPYVAFLQPGYTLSPNPVEVAEVLQVPLRFFQENPPVCKGAWRGGDEVEVYFYYFGDHVIWGLTARMIKEFADVLEPPGLEDTCGAGDPGVS
jgi:8-oxo-dGTP pyrophosphatase MutT (NUDIX family)